MKIIALLIAIFILSNNPNHAQDIVFKRYSIKSGIVKYELGGMQNGTAEMYFDDFGMREATYENAVIEMFGVKQESETVNYLDGYWQYNLDRKLDVATKTLNTELQSIVENSEDGDLIDAGKEMFLSLGGKLVGSEEIIGKSCDIWELASMGTKVWVWNNIPLKTEANMMGMSMLRIAISIEENAEIPSSKLNIPADIDFKEIDLDELQKMMDGDFE